MFKPFETSDNAMCRVFGNFTINAFPLTDKSGVFCHTNSDESECMVYGFLITHPDMHNMIYVTDCSFVRWNFSKHNLHHMLVECNYSDEIINLDGFNKNHILTGHMSLDTCKKFVQANNNGNLETVTLCHLSNLNSDPIEFKDEIQKLVDCKVTVAGKGVVIDLSGKD